MNTTATLLLEPKRGTVSMMEKKLVIVILSLMCSATMCLQNIYESYDFTTPFHGQYCPTEDIIITKLTWHQCKLFCLETPNCQSVNYNFTDRICTYFAVTCPKAISHSGMASVLFTGKLSVQYIERISFEDGDPKRDDRSVTEDNLRFAARMQKNGNDLVAFQVHSTCYARDEEGVFMSSHGYPCQYLRIRDGCTVYYIKFELGAPLPPNALVGEYTAGGLPVYIGIKEGKLKPRSYIPSSNRLAFIGEKAANNVKLLVSL